MFLIAVVVDRAGDEPVHGGRFRRHDPRREHVRAAALPELHIGNVTDAEWQEWRGGRASRDADAEPVADGLPDGTRWAVEHAMQQYTGGASTRGAGRSQAHRGRRRLLRDPALDIAKGRAFTPQEVRSRLAGGRDRRRASRAHFFPSLDPLGRELKIGGIPYRVIGVVEQQGNVFGHVARQVRRGAAQVAG